MTSDSENVSANNLDTAVNDMAQSYINDDKENEMLKMKMTLT